MTSTRCFSLFQQDIEIEQGGVPEHVSETHTGSTVWDCGLVLAKFLENTAEFPPASLRRKRAIELGSGTGIVGIVVAALGAHVTLTDKADLLPLLRRNIQRNSVIVAQRATAAKLEWGCEADIQAVAPPFDFIFLSDCTYDPTSYDALIATIVALSHNQSKIYIAHELRARAEGQFFSKLKSGGFELEKIPNTELDEQYCSDDIGVFRAVPVHSQNTESTDAVS